MDPVLINIALAFILVTGSVWALMVAKVASDNANSRDGWRAAYERSENRYLEANGRAEQHRLERDRLQEKLSGVATDLRQALLEVEDATNGE